MITSDPFPFTFQGKPATMRVFRNNGTCWGRLNAGTREFDVCPARDQYDRDDAEAAATMIRAAQRGNYELPAGWVGA